MKRTIFFLLAISLTVLLNAAIEIKNNDGKSIYYLLNSETKHVFYRDARVLRELGVLRELRESVQREEFFYYSQYSQYSQKKSHKLFSGLHIFSRER